MPQGKVREGFRYDFGAGANNLTVDVPAGARCVWHEENGCWYVDENDVPAYAKHDAIYRGIKVHPDNVEPWRKIPTDARFEAGTKTIRSVPENY